MFVPQALALDVACVGEQEVLTAESLGALHQLTSLHLWVEGEPATMEVWHALGRLANLQDLQVTMLGWQYYRGIQELTSCRRLTHLCVTVDTDNGEDLRVVNQVGAGRPF